MALRIFQRADWERRLRDEQGCRPASEDPECDAPQIKSGEWWLTRHGFLFPVPVDDRGVLRSDDLQKVLVEIASLNPLDFDT